MARMFFIFKTNCSGGCYSVKQGRSRHIGGPFRIEKPHSVCFYFFLNICSIPHNFLEKSLFDISFMATALLCLPYLLKYRKQAEMCSFLKFFHRTINSEAAFITTHHGRYRSRSYKKKQFHVSLLNLLISKGLIWMTC